MKKTIKSKSSFRASFGDFYSKFSQRNVDRKGFRLFDREWYKAMYLQDKPDIDPVAHYIAFSKTGAFDPHPLIDSSFYIDKYPECLSYSKSVVEYFIEVGIESSHSPNRFFDAVYYRSKYSDIRSSSMDYFSHYVNHGWRERRSTHPLFDHTWYIDNNPDVAAAGIDGLQHYIRLGMDEGRDPHILLDVDYLKRQSSKFPSDYGNLIAKYIEDNNFWIFDPCESFEVSVYSENSGLNNDKIHPLIHYLTEGSYRFNPNRVFDTKFYISNYPDVVSAGANPLAHYLKSGALEGRNPSKYFDTKWYRSSYHDIIGKNLNPLSHYLRFGEAEGRACRPPSGLDLNKSDTIYDHLLLTHIKGEAFLRSGKILSFPDHRRPIVTIILVLFNKYYLTVECLESILSNVDYEICPYKIIIYNNGSSDETLILKERVKNVSWIDDASNSGFILGVNTAAGYVETGLVLLLNNDTYVLSGSLERAVSVINSRPDVGVVGAKLIFPTGLLQEAGSIVWNDGSCLGYCRDASPNAPEANFQRDVDYVSGAFLLTKMELFNELGKLNEDYRPAYYEETDYCTKVRDEKLRVVYDPFVEIIHNEFGSSESKSNAILQQEKNRSIYVARHPALRMKYDPLPANILKARFSNSKRPKVLVIDDKIPYRSLGSGFPRSQELLHHLSKEDLDITFVPTNDVIQSWRDVRTTLDDRVEVIFGCNGDDVIQHLDSRRNYYDAVVVSRPHNMVRVRHAIEQEVVNKEDVFIVYDAEALFTYRDVLQSKVQGIYIDDDTIDSLVDAEIRLSEDADLIVSVSQSEAKIFDKLGKPTIVLGHSLLPTPTQMKFSERRDMLFVGSLEDANTPNTDSVLWFLREIFPLIKLRLADCRLHLIGNMKSSDVKRVLSRDVFVHGKIDDLTSYYDSCKLFIAPTRFAAGIPHKVHEASAYGLPCVTTSLLADQLNWLDGVELLASDEPNVFAMKCVDLYNSEELWCRIRRNALASIESDCSEQKFASNVRDICEQISKFHDRKKSVSRL